MALSLIGVNAITHKEILPRMYNVVFKSSALLVRARTRNAYRYYGGTVIQEPITYKKLPGGPFARGSSVDISWVNTETAFFVNPKFYSVSVTLFAADGVMNMGDAAALSQVSAKLANAAATMGENLALDMYYSGLATAAVATNYGTAGGPVTSNGDTTTLSLDGLAQWLDDGNTVTTVGGVTRTDLNATAGTVGGGNAYCVNATTSAAVGILGTPTLNTAIGKSWFGPNRVDLIVCNQDTYMYLNNKLQPSQRFHREDADVVKAGFQAMNYMGADVVVDNYAPSGVMIGLNSKYLHFHVSENRLFQWGFTGFKEDQATVGDVTGQYAFGGNITYPDPRTGFALAGITG